MSLCQDGLGLADAHEESDFYRNNANILNNHAVSLKTSTHEKIQEKEYDVLKCLRFGLLDLSLLKSFEHVNDLFHSLDDS